MVTSMRGGRRCGLLRRRLRVKSPPALLKRSTTTRAGGYHSSASPGLYCFSLASFRVCWCRLPSLDRGWFVVGTARALHGSLIALELAFTDCTFAPVRPRNPTPLGGQVRWRYDPGPYLHQSCSLPLRAAWFDVPQSCHRRPCRAAGLGLELVNILLLDPDETADPVVAKLAISTQLVHRRWGDLQESSNLRNCHFFAWFRDVSIF